MPQRALPGVGGLDFVPRRLLRRREPCTDLRPPEVPVREVAEGWLSVARAAQQSEVAHEVRSEPCRSAVIIRQSAFGTACKQGPPAPYLGMAAAAAAETTSATTATTTPAATATATATAVKRRRAHRCGLGRRREGRRRLFLLAAAKPAAAAAAVAAAAVAAAAAAKGGRGRGAAAVHGGHRAQHAVPRRHEDLVHHLCGRDPLKEVRDPLREGTNTSSITFDRPGRDTRAPRGVCDGRRRKSVHCWELSAPM